MSSSEDEPATFKWSAEAGSQSDSSSRPSPSSSDESEETSRDGQQVWGEPDIHCSAAQWPIFDSDESDNAGEEPSKLTFNFKSLDKHNEDSSNWTLSMRFPSNGNELRPPVNEPIPISSRDSQNEGHDDPRPGPSTSQAPDDSAANFRAHANYDRSDGRPLSKSFKKMYKEVMDRIDASEPKYSSSSEDITSGSNETESSSFSDSSSASSSRLHVLTGEYVDLLRKSLYNKDEKAGKEKSEDESADHESDLDYEPSEFDYETSESMGGESDDSSPRPRDVPSYVSLSPHGSPPPPPSTDDESGYDTDHGQYTIRVPRGAAGLVLLPAPVPGHGVFIAHAFGLDGNPLRNEAGGRNLHPRQVGDYRQEERQNAGQRLAGHVRVQGRVDNARNQNDGRALPIIPANPDQIVALANQRERNVQEHHVRLPAHHADAHGRQGQAIPQAAPQVVQPRARPVLVPRGDRVNAQQPRNRDRPVSRRRSRTSRSNLSSLQPGPSTSTSLTSVDYDSTPWSSTGGGDLTSSAGESVFFSSGNEGAGDSLPYNQMLKEMQSTATTEPVPSTSTAKSSISSGSSTAPNPSTSTGSYTLYGSALRLSESTSRHAAPAASTQPSTSGITYQQRHLSPCDVEADDETSDDGCKQSKRKVVRRTTRMSKQRRQRLTEDWEDRRLVDRINATIHEPCNKLPYEKRKRSPTPCESSGPKRARLEEPANSLSKQDHSVIGGRGKRKAEDDLGQETTSCPSSTKRAKIQEDPVPSTSKLIESGTKMSSKKRKSDSDHEFPPSKKSRSNASGSSSSEDSSADTSQRNDSGFTDDVVANSSDDIDDITASVLDCIGEADEYILLP